jgi:hypothetical protein
MLAYTSSSSPQQTHAPPPPPPPNNNNNNNNNNHNNNNNNNTHTHTHRRQDRQMGISGLLPVLRPITSTVHVRELRGLRVGVDAYVWLHRGVYGCAADLCQGRPTKKYLNYCIERLNVLLNAGIQVYIVFDGGPLPAKKGTEQERRARREESKLKALQCLGEGKASEAFKHFSTAVDVTPAMAKEWIKTIQGVPNVSFVVAPYEADAQLAFLSRAGLLDAVITEVGGWVGWCALPKPDAGCRWVALRPPIEHPIHSRRPTHTHTHTPN